ncbi:MAG: cell envelope integrity protein TolA [Arenicellales bacterium]|nr:cell envelope integrity protein TolA [Arenicellales bacterium]
MSRSPRKAASPIRGFIYAVLIHIIFGALIGVSLWFQPQVIEPLPGKPVQAKAIDLAAIERAEAEKKRKATEKKKAAEKKKKEEALRKKKAAEKKKKAEVEKKRKAAEKKAREAAEAQAQLERDEQEAVSAFGALVWAIQQRVSSNWSEPGDFSGMSVSFLVKVDRDGNVISVTITKKSGDSRLDESAENAIFKASPLPFPTEPRYYEYLKEFNFVFKP